MSRDHTSPVWDRPEPKPRPIPVALDRDTIVRVSIALADAKGLDGVSLRKVGAALGAGAMRLYRFMSTKEELLDLMVDAAYGEIVNVPAHPADWREATTALIQAMRRTALTHRWFAQLLGGRPPQGPNGLAYMEALLSALAGCPALPGINDVFQAGKTLTAYAIGAIMAEVHEGEAEAATGLKKAEWQAASAPYMRRMIATGKFPTLARVVTDARHPSFNDAFARGLEQVLDGIAAREN